MSQTLTQPVQPTVESPPSRRLTRARWRDPRLWMGLLLVAASVLVGTRLLAEADNTVGVWAVRHDIGAGAPLTPSALVVRQVRFTDATTADNYLLASRPLPDGVVVGSDLAAGELLAQSALSQGGGAAFELPVVVDAAGAPEELRVGNIVDVWVAPEDALTGGKTEAEQVLSAVPVVGTSRSVGPLGEAATRQVLLGIGEKTAADLGSILRATSSGSVVLVRHGSGR
ncbi:MAG: hypothetical protein ACRDOY_03140 [Nocardioidaceae bacterium]